MKKNKKKIKPIYKILIVIVLVIIAECCFQIWRKVDNEKNQENLVSSNVKEEQEVIPDTTIKMAVIGDIMCHNSNYFDAYNDSTGRYDFSYVFTDIKEELQSADITVGNLETTFAGPERGYTSYPTFNTPEALANNLKEIGIDLLSTANNHSLDKGYSGLESTIAYLDQEGITHTGTFTSQESQNTVIIQNVNGINIAFLSFTYGTNGIPVQEGKEYCINLISDELILSQLSLAKEQSPDLICVFMHWGDEYKLEPNAEQERLANLLFDNGVDIILGSHPHVLERMEKRTIIQSDGTTKDGFLIYSLGNFMSGQVKENTKDSIILNLTITKSGETGVITIDSATYTPIYMYKSATETIRKYKILDIEKTIDNFENGNPTVTQTEYEMLKKEYEKITSIVGTEF